MRNTLTPRGTNDPRRVYEYFVTYGYLRLNVVHLRAQLAVPVTDPNTRQPPCFDTTCDRLDPIAIADLSIARFDTSIVFCIQ